MIGSDVQRAIDEIDTEIRALQKAREVLVRVAGGGSLRGALASAVPAAPAANDTRLPASRKAGKQPAKRVPTAKPARNDSANDTSGVRAAALNPGQRAGYAEILRQLAKPVHRAKLLEGRPPQASKKLNAMQRHALIIEEDGFVRITEAGEIFLADCDA